MNILVTGGAGFIGSHLCIRLIQDGHRVCAVDDMSGGRMDNLRALRGDLCFRFVKLDVNDQPRLERLMRRTRFGAVFHLAANPDVHRGAENPDVDFLRTLSTTHHVLAAMRETGTRQLIFISSSAVYGRQNRTMREDDGPLRPVSAYGACKLASEALISAAVDNHKLQAWILRPANVVGPRARHGVIPDFVRKLRKNPDHLHVLGDGRQSKQYIHIEDMVEGVWIAWKKARAPLNVFNIAPRGSTTVKRIAAQMAGQLGGKAKISFQRKKLGWVGDVPRFRLDASRLRKRGWRARMDSDAAVKKAVFQAIHKTIGA